MKYKLIFGLIILSIFSTSVFASDNAPPAIPMEVWGQATVDGGPAANNLSLAAEVDGVDYTQGSPVTFNDGYYNVMLVGGDRELTYLSDPTCATHWPNEACVPCSTNQVDEDYCIEGPRDDAKISIKISTIGAMPFLSWLLGSSEEVEVITPIGDWDENGCTDMGDFVGPFTDNYLATCEMISPLPVCLIFDLNLDGTIDMGDFVGPFTDHYNEGCGG